MLKNLKLRTKMLFMVIPLGMVCIMAIGFLTNLIGSTLRKTEELYIHELYDTSTNCLAAERDFYQSDVGIVSYMNGKSYADDNTLKSYLYEYESNKQEVIDGIAVVEDRLAKSEALQTYKYNSLTLPQYLSSFHAHYESWNNAYNPETDEGSYVTQLSYFNIARKDITSINALLQAYAAEQKEIMESEIKAERRTVLIAISIVLVAAAIFCVYVIRYIRMNITTVTGQVNTIADQDLTDDFAPLDSKDELGQLSRAAYTLRTHLLEMVETLRSSSAELSAHSDHMDHSTKEAAQSVKNIDNAATELATTATHTAGDVSDLSGNMNNISSMMRQSIESTQSLKEACVNIEKITSDGMTKVDELTTITDKNVEAFNSIFEAIDTIEEKAGKISVASDLISEIADQTNLLSLNASIEAARAGDAGRGFAVVADEIRKLAEQSGGAVETITQMLNELSQSSKDAATKSDMVRGYVESQKDSVSKTRDSFESIVSNINVINDGVNTLNGVNDNLGNGVSSAQSIIDSLSAISQENAATAEELNATTTTVANNVDDLQVAGESVNDSSKKLNEIIHRFKIKEEEE